ncbi:MAG: murein biosynthesis integral membrane protein MurJ [Pseudomonadota bacterium]
MHALAKVGGNTTLSRILGFVRDLVFARLFGANEMTDAFFVAFKIPNFLRRLFAEGAFSVAFVPVLSEYKTTRSFEDLKTFVDHVASTLGLILLIVSVIGVLGAPLLIALFAPGWYFGDSGNAELAAEMLRLTFPYLLFISLTAFAGGILNTHNQFGIPAFTPVLLNLVLIACAYWLSPLVDPPIMSLAWGVLFAGIAQFAFQLPFLARLKLLPKFTTPTFRDEGISRVLRLMAPAIFGVSVTQLNLLLDTLIASFLQKGSISWLYYSDRLMEFPVGILGVALGTVILPNLSKKHAESSPREFSAMLDWAMRWAVLLGIPAAVGLLVLAGPLIATLFQSDVFDAQDVRMARWSLMAYSCGLIPFMMIKVLAPGFYAQQDTKTPVKIAIVAMVVNMVMNIILMQFLQHAGLALATSIAATVNATLLFRILRKREIYQPPRGWLLLLLRAGIAAAVMGGMLLWLAGPLQQWLDAGWQWKVGHIALWVTAGAALYFATLAVVGIRVRDFRAQQV